MKQFLIQFIEVLRFEICGYIGMKSFRVVTVVIIISVGLLVSLPGAANIFRISQDKIEEKGSLALYNEEYDAEVTKQLFQEKFPDREIILTSTSDINILKQQVKAGNYKAAIKITSPKSYIYVVGGAPLYDNTENKTEEIITSLYLNVKLSELGILSTEAKDLYMPIIKGESIMIGKSSMANLFYTIIFLFIMYCSIVVYSSSIINSIVNEKVSHTAEVLITSVKSNALIFGKVISASIIGLFQTLVIILSSLLFYQINKVALTGHSLVNLIFSFPPLLIGHLILFFILGLLFYFFTFAAFASNCSRAEEANTICTLLNYSLVILFSVMMLLLITDVEGIAMKICSYIPFTSPLAMFARISMSNVALWEIILSVCILLVSIIVIGNIAAKLYRLELSFYGNKQIWKLIRRISNCESGKKQ